MSHNHPETHDTPPLGLVAMFALVRVNDETSIAPTANAARALPAAQRLLRKLQDGADDVSLQQAIIDEAAVMYPGLDVPIDTMTVGITGFYSGFALAWLLLMAINGRDAVPSKAPKPVNKKLAALVLIWRGLTVDDRELLLDQALGIYSAPPLPSRPRRVAKRRVTKKGGAR